MKEIVKIRKAIMKSRQNKAKKEAKMLDHFILCTMKVDVINSLDDKEIKNK